MSYDIVTNRGVVDFALDMDIAEKKFTMYVQDMKLGYSKSVMIIDRKTRQIIRKEVAEDE